VKVKEGETIGTWKKIPTGEGRGNSRQYKDSLFCVSEFFLKGNFMTDLTHSDSPATKKRHPIWHMIIVSTSQGLGGILWRVAWFSLVVWIFLIR
jgi:hypothetical protein